MHAAADGDDSDNVGDAMKLMVMAEGEMKDRATACLPANDLDDAASLGLPLGGRRVLSRGAKRAGRYY